MDAIVSCLAPPPPALTFADAAIARALHHLSSTMSSESASSSSSSLSAPAPHRHQCYSPLLLDLASPAPPAGAYGAPMMTCGDSVLVADSPPAAGRRHHNKLKLAPAGGRAGKRRSRASKRAPTTYISTDPTNFRMMVQHVTGAQGDDDDMRLLMLQQPMLLPGADEASPAAAANNGHNHQQQLQLNQQQPCFPTLDSWNVMYESTDLL
ncbi:hypothetical protein HU200_012686 [Digitaria exilis]|uniref:VQ domain-containing protein n=1 Tax=Digitaria exilis TaxID=1010633 RepID=A0A835KN04_9POAL|nr:hypothetical protein HU200_012686 [Digitaria exilis]CAB3503253.1 unnamed protein product [Digitaria exilis]